MGVAAQNGADFLGAGYALAHNLNGKDGIVCTGFDQQGPRQDQAHQIGHFADIEQTGHKITSAEVDTNGQEESPFVSSLRILTITKYPHAHAPDSEGESFLTHRNPGIIANHNMI